MCLVRFWVALALLLVLMAGTLYLFVIRPSTSHPDGYRLVCAPDLSSCVDQDY
jgi:hypothetical protein